MGKVRDSIDEVIGESNPVRYWQQLGQMPLVGRIVAITDRISC